MRDFTLAANVTKVRLVHASVRQLHKKSGVWDYAKWGEPVSQKYTTGASCVFSVQILQAMTNLGTPEKWLLPKDVDLVDRMWSRERETEWQKSDDCTFMTRQAVKFYRDLLPPGVSDAFLTVGRIGLTDKYADMAGMPESPLDLAGKPLAAGHQVVSGFGSRVLGGGAEKAVGVNPYEEVVGVASKGYNEIVKYAITQGQDDQPQMHQELGDNR